jgi:uncharacterized coiled-coil DUF342 family protein
MSMNFLDDTDDWPEYRIVKNDIHRLEMEHLALSKELQEAESALKSDLVNENLRAKVDRFRKKLEEIQKKLNESLNMYR